MKFYAKSGRQIHYYNEGNIQIDKLFCNLLNCYSTRTTLDRYAKKYNYENNPTYGQCIVTALVFQDLFGGTIHKINYLFDSTHYFNQLNGKYYDLTSDQFDIYNIPINYEKNEQIDRESLDSDIYSKYIELKRMLASNSNI